MYYLISRKNNTVPAVKCEGRETEFDKRNLSFVDTDVIFDQWIQSVKGFCFRICELGDIMHNHEIAQGHVSETDPLFIYKIEIKTGQELVDDQDKSMSGTGIIGYQGKLTNCLRFTDKFDMSNVSHVKKLLDANNSKAFDSDFTNIENLRKYYKWLVANSCDDVFVYLYQVQPVDSVVWYVMSDRKIEWLNFILLNGLAEDPDEIKFNLKYLLGNIRNINNSDDNTSLFQMIDTLLPMVDGKNEIVSLGLNTALDNNSDEIIEHLFIKYISCLTPEELTQILTKMAAEGKLNFVSAYITTIQAYLNTENKKTLYRRALAIESQGLVEIVGLPEGDILKCKIDVENEIDNSLKNDFGIDVIDGDELLMDTDLFEQSVIQGDILAVRILLDYCEDCYNLNNSMIESAKRGYTGLVKLFVEHGADINYNSNYAIKFANKYGYSAMKKYLISKGGIDQHFSI